MLQKFYLVLCDFRQEERALALREILHIGARHSGYCIPHDLKKGKMTVIIESQNTGAER